MSQRPTDTSDAVGLMREAGGMPDQKPLSEQPLPAQIVIWAVALAIAVIVLALAGRLAAEIMGWT